MVVDGAAQKRYRKRRGTPEGTRDVIGQVRVDRSVDGAQPLGYTSAKEAVRPLLPVTPGTEFPRDVASGACLRVLQPLAPFPRTRGTLQADPLTVARERRLRPRLRLTFPPWGGGGEGVSLWAR